MIRQQAYQDPGKTTLLFGGVRGGRQPTSIPQQAQKDSDIRLLPYKNLPRRLLNTYYLKLMVFISPIYRRIFSDSLRSQSAEQYALC